MFTENSTYWELQEAFIEAWFYSPSLKNVTSIRNKKKAFYKTKLPQSKIPVAFNIIAKEKRKIKDGYVFITSLILEGKEGQGFAQSIMMAGLGMKKEEKELLAEARDDCTFITILHSHAINRYIERRNFKGTLEQAQAKILEGINGISYVKDFVNDTYYLYFDGGTFLCEYDTEEDIVHIRTFIMNRQCSSGQRLKSLDSEKSKAKYAETFSKIKSLKNVIKNA